MFINTCSYCLKEYCKRKDEGVQAFKQRKFCSKECNYKSHYKEIICDFCGKKLMVKKGYRKHKRTFCSITCRNRSPRGGIITSNCQVCNKEMKFKRSVPRQYCSITCYQSYNKLKNHYNWKGGITGENERLRQSKEYFTWRAKVYERDRWTCQMCQKHCGKDIVAHHVKTWSEYPKLRFEVSNGIVLCRVCHTKLHKSLKYKV